MGLGMMAVSPLVKVIIHLFLKVSIGLKQDPTHNTSANVLSLQKATYRKLRELIISPPSANQNTVVSDLRNLKILID
jgi:hypothetical protein